MSEVRIPEGWALVTTKILHPIALPSLAGEPHHPTPVEMTTDFSSSRSLESLVRDVPVEVPIEPLLGPRDHGVVLKARGLATLLQGALAAGGPRHASMGKHTDDAYSAVALASMAHFAIGGQVLEDEVDVTSTS